ncbi:MAG TPA: HIRAN domain-containing protein [Bryobacteraceae bacterium]|jgi:hypothetical protein|nr:HIRAN domain-containing protein [Bryobacteraceae bacterium]
MARRRVFRTNIECPLFGLDVAVAANRAALVGQDLTFETADTVVNVFLQGLHIGQLAPELSVQLRTFVDGGHILKASIEKAVPVYNTSFAVTGVSLQVRVEYLLEKDRSPIVPPTKPTLLRDAEYPSRSFFTKVAGVTHEGRQRIVARCSVGEELRLVRDPNNPFDAGAIKIMRLNGQQLGFIPQHVSRDGDPSGLAAGMDRGSVYACRIKDLTGGIGQKSRGVNIEVTQCDGSSLHGSASQVSAPPRSALRSGSGCLSVIGAIALCLTALAVAAMN